MDVTCLSLKHDIIFHNFTIKSFKPHSSNPNVFKLVSPVNSGKIHASVVLRDGDHNQKNEEDEDLPADLLKELMPKHIGFIMDGNRRWAVERGWPPESGHFGMRMAMIPFLRQCCKMKIKAASLYILSYENFNNRPPVEVDFLLEVSEDILTKDTKELLSLGCRLTVMGNKTKLPKSLQKLCAEVEEISKANTGTHVNYGIGFSGKQDIVQACQSIARKVKDGVLLPSEINETCFKQQLYTKTNDFPYPDLVLRTSGELRISNFLLWQMAYSHLHFIKKYFPDFGEDDLIEALHAFQKWKRRG